jgi:hypothetical protein
MIGLMPGQWAPDWTLHAYAPEQELRISFPPSYVLAGSATAELVSGATTRTWWYQQNGYQHEWTHLADVAEGLTRPAIDIDVALADLRFALKIAEEAGAATVRADDEVTG